MSLSTLYGTIIHRNPFQFFNSLEDSRFFIKADCQNTFANPFEGSVRPSPVFRLSSPPVGISNEKISGFVGQGLIYTKH